jgi:DnaJ-class molecular chaperone
MKDPYTVLGVERGTGQDDIKRAYHKLAKALHPDVNPDDKSVEQRFKEVSAAYNFLSDKEKRAKFDRGEIGADGTPRYESAFHRAYTGGGQARGGNRGADFGHDFEDLFSDLFGQARRQKTARSSRVKGQDIQYSMAISLEEAVKGVSRRVKLYDGKSIEVRIPPGTEDGQALRLKGKGSAGFGGGPAGDAFVTVQVKTHKHFRLENKDIHLNLPVTLDEAVLGAKIKVPTVDGAVSLTIPAGANTGRRLRLKGKGMPAKSGGTRGDQIIHLEVMLPEKPDADLKRFLEEWSKRNAYDVRKKAGFEDG